MENVTDSSLIEPARYNIRPILVAVAVLVGVLACAAGFIHVWLSHWTYPEPVGMAVPSDVSHMVLYDATPRARFAARFSDVFSVFAFGYGVTILILVLRTGLSSAFRAVAEKITRLGFVRTVLYIALLSTVLTATSLPISLFGLWYQWQFGLSTESFGTWATQWLTGFLVSLLTLEIVGVIVFALMRRFKRWWFPLWLSLIPIIAVGIFVAPIVVDPLFNTYTPMPPTPLKTRLEQLASRAGVPNIPIYVVDKSKQTNTTNAYVTGLGGSARIVIWDTLLKKMDANEVVAIVGHEMGHYVLHHVFRGYVFTVLGLVFLLPLGQYGAEHIVRRKGTKWCLRGASDIAVFPIFLFLLSCTEFVLQPVTNGISREIEHEADAYGLKITHDGDDMARAFIALSAQNLGEPDPPKFIVWWRYSHPPIRDRVEFVLGHPVPLVPYPIR